MTVENQPKTWRSEDLPEGLIGIPDAAQKHGLQPKTLHTWVMRGYLSIHGQVIRPSQRASNVISERELVKFLENPRPLKARGFYRKCPDGTRRFDQDAAIRMLLEQGVLKTGYGPDPDIPVPDGDDPWDHCTIVLHVNANDIFAWGASRSVGIGDQDELESLTLHHLENLRWGRIRWCCKKEQLKPQESVAQMMQNEGEWDSAMDRLPS